MTRVQNRNLTPGGPGRPRGCKNKRTRAAADVAAGMLSDPKYLKSLRRRLLAGKAPHMEVLLHHYAYGKPVDRMTLLQKQTNADEQMGEIQRSQEQARAQFFAMLAAMQRRLLATGQLQPNGDVLIPAAAHRSPMERLALYSAAGGGRSCDESLSAIS
jgi:hypothetical protein